MKKNLLIPVILLISSFVYGQKDSADYFYQQALAENAAGRKLEVLKNLEVAFRHDPTNRNIVKDLAETLLDLRKYVNAREMFKVLEAMVEPTPSLYKQLFTLHYNTKKFDDALQYAEKLKKADPSEKLSYHIGKIYYDREDYGQAITHLKAAEKEDPDNAEVPYLLGRSYADMMNYKQAIPYMKKAINLDVTKSYWVYELALVCYAIHADNDALKYMLLAGERGYKKNNDYNENLGIAYLNTGNLEQGVKILDEILVKKPGDLNILNIIAESYYYAGKYQPAIDYWDRILEFDKTSAQSLYMIGMAYQKKGEKDKGIALCDKAIEMDPSLSSLKQKKMNIGL